MKYREIIAPTDWANYLINNDPSSLTETEIDECNSFFDDQGLIGRWCLSCQPVGIMRFNGLLTNCEEYVFTVEE